MSLSTRRKRVTVVVGGVAILLATVAVVALTNGVFISGTVPLEASDGPKVNVTTGSANQLDLTSPYPDANTVVVTSDEGTVEFESVGSSDASISTDDLEGTWTIVSGIDASSNDLTINPGDKQAATVGAGISSLQFRDPTANDDNTDFSYAAGSTAKIVLRGVTANERYRAVASDGSALQAADADGTGTITFDSLPGGDYDVELVTGVADPLLSNLHPEGELSTEPSTFSVDVQDGDFPLDEVNVSFYLEGDYIASDTLTSAGEANATIPQSGQTGGSHTWTVEAEDDYGRTATLSRTYYTPDVIQIRNESDPDTLVSSQTDVRMTFVGDDTVLEFETTAGEVNMTDLPVNQNLFAQVEAVGYYPRTVHIQSIYEQQAVYVLPINATTVTSRFLLEDSTGRFPSTSTLYISRPITRDGNTSYRTIHADEFGVEGVTATLEQGVRYRLRIESPSGEMQDMGVYRATESETVTLRPGSPAIDFDRDEDGWGVSAALDNRTLTYHYDDPSNETDWVRVTVFEDGNPQNIIDDSETYYSNSVDAQFTLSENESNLQLVVRFEIRRNGETITKDVEVSKRGDLVPPGLDTMWKHVAGVALLLLSAGTISVLNRRVGAVILGLEGGLLWWTGWLEGATVAAAIVVYLLVAVIYLFRSDGF